MMGFVPPLSAAFNLKKEITMKHRNNEAPNYTSRRVAAAALAGLALLGVYKGGNAAVDAWNKNQVHMNYVRNPNTIPENERVTIPVIDGDTASGIAREYSPQDANSADLTLEILNQSDDKGFLHPGQTVVVERSLLDPQKAADLVKQQPALE
jgi:hypothetical protein